MYLVTKALHIVFMVAWFAGLFYIFRLFVYHRAQHTKKEICELLSLMEKRLLNYITLPASIAVAVFGFSLIAMNPQLMNQPWLLAKLILVFLLYGYQYFAFYTYNKFKNNDFFISEKACRIINEVPTLLLICIVLMAVRKVIF